MNSSIGAEGEPAVGGILRSCIKLSSAFKYGVNAAVSFGRIEKTSERYSTSNSLESCFNSVAHSSIGGSFGSENVYPSLGQPSTVAALMERVAVKE
jgi:hypothetical protein